MNRLSSSKKILLKMGDDEPGKVYVGSMDFNTEDRELRETFEQYGIVSEGKF